MKKDVTISTLLGIKQKDAADLLGVSIGQWSMYSAGKRDLPASAMILLAEILTYINTADAAAKGKEEKPKKESIEQLERLLLENRFRQTKLERKIAATARKQLAQSRMLLLSGFLEQQETGKQNAFGLSEVFKNKALKPSKVSFSALLSEQLHQQEVLVFEEELLQSKLEGLR